MTPLLPVMRPLLPKSRALSPYLRRIDENRWYSNMGPLAQELAARLEAHHQGQVLPLANATVGLTAALLANQVAGGASCLMPSWSFAATAQAARLAGLTPLFCDVEAGNGVLTPALAEQALVTATVPVAAVIPVCPFGHPVDWSGWQEFQRRHSVPVVIDAASAFDIVQASDVAAVVSLHATKSLGAGEGGYVLCRNGDLLQRISRSINFGMDEQRRSIVIGGNGKMSEYHAAVALAALDQWPARRRKLVALLARLRRTVGDRASWPTGLGDDFVTSTACVDIGDALAAQDHLHRHRVESRRWWSAPLHRHPVFATDQVLPATQRLADATLGLPCWIGMTAEHFDQLAAALRHFSPDQPATRP